jgi:hypothetical protein
MCKSSTCSVEGCGKPSRHRGLCESHYRKYRASDDFEPHIPMNQTPCSVEGCDRRVVAAGICNMHYLRLTRTGTLAPRLRRAIEAKMQANIKPVGDCWEWQGQVMANGYGVVFYDGRKRLAHRVMYELTHGPVDNGLFCCHRCDNPRCVNPKHIFLGTHKENMADMDSKGRRRAAKGERQHKAKLTDGEVLEIRRLYAAGVTITEIARRFPVTPASIGAIVHGRTWRHLP